MVTSHKKFTLDLADCFIEFNHSVNRVNLFSCIAQNITEEDLPRNWIIKNDNGVDYGINANPDNDERNYILNGYKHFVQLYLVRDLIETFALSLDTLFMVLLADGKTSQGGYLIDLLNEDDLAELKDFKQTGLTKKKKGKIEKLQSRFGLELSQESNSIIKSLRDIRNCFAHTNGRVRETDGAEAEGNKRKFVWKTMKIWAENEDTGETFAVKSNELVPAGLAVKTKIDTHEKSYTVGDSLSFTPVESYEIAFSLGTVVQEYLQSFNRFKEAVSN